MYDDTTDQEKIKSPSAVLPRRRGFSEKAVLRGDEKGEKGR
jgi:hypothetical protein